MKLFINSSEVGDELTFRSYLEDRTFCVNLNNFQSSSAPLLYVVPQGSVLGPLLFSLYLLPLGSFLRKNDDGKVGSKQLTLAEATPGKSMADANAESEMLAELKKFRKENMDSFCDLKSSLNRLENTMEELKQRTEVSAKEDSHIQHEKVLSYLLHREASLASKCDDMENRLWRNNI
uniref:Uncharacterized protein n=1 Tax=Oryzias latipes TaxID=8090 RepID=A0A3P9JNI0_ORYLA